MRTTTTSLRSIEQRGFSLIEVMIAVLVLALGMLGIASLQATALRNSQSAYERSQGVVQTYSIIDSMRANKAEAVVNNYDLAETCAPLDPGGTLAAEDLRLWIDAVQANLGPTACGTIDCVQSECAVTVTWNDSRGTDGDEAYTVTTRTRL